MKVWKYQVQNVERWTSRPRYNNLHWTMEKESMAPFQDTFLWNIHSWKLGSIYEAWFSDLIFWNSKCSSRKTSYGIYEEGVLSNTKMLVDRISLTIDIHSLTHPNKSFRHCSQQDWCDGEQGNKRFNDSSSISCSKQEIMKLLATDLLLSLFNMHRIF